MNRVVLCGRLAGRPKLAYTPAGIPVAEFRLLVPRERRPDLAEPALEGFDCVCFRQEAVALTSWGERDYRINLEGRLHAETYYNLDGRRIEGVRIHADRTDFVDPVAVGLGTDARALPKVPLPVAVHPLPD